MKEIFNRAINAALVAGQKIMEIYTTDDFDITKKQDLSPLTKADRAAHEIIVSLIKEDNIPILSEEGKAIPFTNRADWYEFWLVDPLDGTKEFIKRNDEFTVNIALIRKGSPAFGVVFAPALKDLYIGIPGKGSWLIKHPKATNDFDTLCNKGSLLKSNQTEQSHARSYRVVASRSHLNKETENYLDALRTKYGEVEIVSKGSSLKLCMVASGEADEYPRLGPTMEWDVGAAHAVVTGAGKKVIQLNSINTGDKVYWERMQELKYNKENLLNPYFLVI